MPTVAKKKSDNASQHHELGALRKRADKIIKATRESVRRLKILQAEIEERLQNQRPLR
jgi:hypothetical protein